MRNPNGYGGVVKLSGNRRKPYMARITAGWDGKKQIFKPIGYFEDSPSALLALAEYHKNPIPPKLNITLEELYNEWSVIKYEYISKKTTENYKAGWNHISKYGKFKFTELRTVHFQGIIDGLCKAGMSRSTLEKVKVLISMLYDYAIQNDIINKNYGKFIHLPKSNKQEKEIFTDIELQTLFKADSDEWVMTILILNYTGLRLNELLGLTPFCVDMNNQTMTGGLKTEAGKDRTVPIHPKILKYVQYWLDKKGDFLICKNDGKRIRDNYYRKKLYYPTHERLGIRKLNPHCCRHTFATILRKSGADTKTIQKLMGHTKYSFTADVYTHTNIEELKAAVNLIK